MKLIRETCLSYARDKKEEARKLIEEYPGVRPAWVSSEIAALQLSAEFWEQKAKSCPEDS